MYQSPREKEYLDLQTIIQNIGIDLVGKYIFDRHRYLHVVITATELFADDYHQEMIKRVMRKI